MAFGRTKTAVERINALIEEEGSCWVWMGASYGGIPSVNMKQANGKWRNKNVRRVLLEERGESLAGKYVVACCGERMCVNPDHLKALSQKENLKRANDSISALSRRRASAKTFEKQRKINSSIASEIRVSDLPSRELAEMHGLSIRTIQNIRRGDTWKTNFFTGLM